MCCVVIWMKRCDNVHALGVWPTHSGPARGLLLLGCFQSTYQFEMFGRLVSNQPPVFRARVFSPPP